MAIGDANLCIPPSMSDVRAAAYTGPRDCEQTRVAHKGLCNKYVRKKSAVFDSPSPLVRMVYLWLTPPPYVLLADPPPPPSSRRTKDQTTHARAVSRGIKVPLSLEVATV